MKDVSGSTIKAYRERLQLSQRDFAELLGTSQGLISLVELARTPVSRKLVRLLRIKGDEGVLKPSLAAYLGQDGLDDGTDDLKIQVVPPIPLERWGVRIDLRKRADLGARGRIILPRVPDGARAFQFSPPPSVLAPNDVAIFKPARLRDLTDDQIVLVQLHSRGRVKALAAKVAHLGRVIVSRQGRATIHQFEPAVDKVPVIGLNDDNVDVVMSCFFHGRYCG